MSPGTSPLWELGQGIQFVCAVIGAIWVVCYLGYGLIRLVRHGRNH